MSSCVPPVVYVSHASGSACGVKCFLRLSGRTNLVVQIEAAPIRMSSKYSQLHPDHLMPGRASSRAANRTGWSS